MKEFDKDLQAKVENHLKTTGMSANDFGKAVGYSSTTISHYRSSIYKGDVAEIERKIRDYFANIEEAEKARHTVEYVETGVSKGVYNTIRLCHSRGGLAVEVGDAGIGKTMAAQKYVEAHPSAIYICINVCTNSVAAVLKEIARNLHVPATGRKEDLWVRINEVLKNGKRVLIVDESQHLPIKTVELLRAFSDQNKNLGICFIGNHQSIFNNGLPEYAQITSRTKMRNSRSIADIKLEDIKLIFPDLDEKSAKFLYQLSQTSQGLRGAFTVYETAMKAKNITYDVLVDAVQLTHAVGGLNE